MMDTQQHTERWQLAETLLLKLTNSHAASEASQELGDILQELRLYQAELVVQNRQLRRRHPEIESERQRITHGLYDAVNQSLFSAHLISEVLLEPSMQVDYEEQANLRHLNTSIKCAIAEMRILLLELKPERLLDTPLETLLRQLLYSFDDTDVTVEYDFAGSMRDDVKIAIYRLAQEALMSIYYRANASKIHIQLRQNLTGLRFHIRDNGIGFDTDSSVLDSELDYMRGGVEASGGQFQITSQLNIGTQITAEW